MKISIAFALVLLFAVSVSARKRGGRHGRWPLRMVQELFAGGRHRGRGDRNKQHNRGEEGHVRRQIMNGAAAQFEYSDIALVKISAAMQRFTKAVPKRITEKNRDQVVGVTRCLGIFLPSVDDLHKEEIHAANRQQYYAALYQMTQKLSASGMKKRHIMKAAPCPKCCDRLIQIISSVQLNKTNEALLRNITGEVGKVMRKTFPGTSYRCSHNDIVAIASNDGLEGFKGVLSGSMGPGRGGKCRRMGGAGVHGRFRLGHSPQFTFDDEWSSVSWEHSGSHEDWQDSVEEVVHPAVENKVVTPQGRPTMPGSKDKYKTEIFEAVKDELKKFPGVNTASCVPQQAFYTGDLVLNSPLGRSVQKASLMALKKFFFSKEKDAGSAVGERSSFPHEKALNLEHIFNDKFFDDVLTGVMRFVDQLTRGVYVQANFEFGDCMGGGNEGPQEEPPKAPEPPRGGGGGGGGNHRGPPDLGRALGGLLGQLFKG